MTRRLGDFTGELTEAEVLTFGYFGTEIRVNPAFGELDVFDFMEEASSLDENDPAAMTLIKRSLRACVHEDDFDQFWKLARRNRQTSADLTQIFRQVLEAVTDRPTQQPSDSSDGPVSIGTKSTGGSSSAVVRRLEAQGRPDLALAVVRAQEAQPA